MAKYEKDDGLERIGASLIATRREFAHLRGGCNIAFQRCDVARKKEGKNVYADCTRVSDKMRGIAHCEFVITFYADATALPPDIQERVMYHELLHVGYDQETGRCYIVPHDLEDFKACIDRWGTDWVKNAENRQLPP